MNECSELLLQFGGHHQALARAARGQAESLKSVFWWSGAVEPATISRA
ncbi:MAG: hypothetical protein ACLR2G_10440 [Phascolarctobacterium faecium]